VFGVFVKVDIAERHLVPGRRQRKRSFGVFTRFGGDVSRRLWADIGRRTGYRWWCGVSCTMDCWTAGMLRMDNGDGGDRQNCTDRDGTQHQTFSPAFSSAI
jgi:hypothetical protein